MLYRDRRLGDLEIWSLGRPADWGMRVPDILLTSVCFIGVQPRNDPPEWGGTAFFLSIPLEGAPQWSWTYLITARHNLDGALARSAEVDGHPCIRLNTTDGDGMVVDISGAAWMLPDNPGADIAVLEWTPPIERVAFSRVPRSVLVTPELALQENIGIGDELATVGLFTRRAGHVRNEPIVRTGVICGTPSEPLPHAVTGAPMDGCYLAEIRSIGGLSGSPVYVFLPVGRTWTAEPRVRHESTYYLLGLMHGHWDLDQSEFLATDYGGDPEPLNTGIGVVVPITEALALIDSPTEIARRREAAVQANLEDAHDGLDDLADRSKIPSQGRTRLRRCSAIHSQPASQ